MIDKIEFKLNDKSVLIKSETPTIHFGSVVKFCCKYLTHLICGEIMIPDRLGIDSFDYFESSLNDKKIIQVMFLERSNLLQLYVNNELHIEMTRKLFHNAQLKTELQGQVHQSFFLNLHSHKVDGEAILEF
jgi:hypothetical protein